MQLQVTARLCTVSLSIRDLGLDPCLLSYPDSEGSRIWRQRIGLLVPALSKGTELKDIKPGFKLHPGFATLCKRPLNSPEPPICPLCKEAKNPCPALFTHRVLWETTELGKVKVFCVHSSKRLPKAHPVRGLPEFWSSGRHCTLANYKLYSSKEMQSCKMYIFAFICICKFGKIPTKPPMPRCKFLAGLFPCSESHYCSAPCLSPTPSGAPFLFHTLLCGIHLAPFNAALCHIPL